MVYAPHLTLVNNENKTKLHTYTHTYTKKGKPCYYKQWKEPLLINYDITLYQRHNDCMATLEAKTLIYALPSRWLYDFDED